MNVSDTVHWEIHITLGAVLVSVPGFFMASKIKINICSIFPSSMKIFYVHSFIMLNKDTKVCFFLSCQSTKEMQKVLAQM